MGLLIDLHYHRFKTVLFIKYSYPLFIILNSPVVILKSITFITLVLNGKILLISLYDCKSIVYLLLHYFHLFLNIVVCKKLKFYRNSTVKT